MKPCICAEWARQCMATYSRPSSATMGNMSGSANPPLTSLTIVAPAAAHVLATAARVVSMLTGTALAASASTTGTTRSSSTSSGTRWAPGRVDSPPTSIQAAPSAAIPTPASMAAASVGYRPPSLKESGVTFSTPTTTVTGPGSATLPRPEWPSRAVVPVRRWLSWLHPAYGSRASPYTSAPLR